MTTTARRRDCHLTCRHPSGRERAKRPAGRIPPAPPAVVKRPRKTPRPLAKRSPRELSELAAAGPPPSPVLHRTTYLGCHLHVFAEGSRARQVALKLGSRRAQSVALRPAMRALAIKGLREGPWR